MQTLQLALTRFGFHKWQNLLFFIASLLCVTAGVLFVCLSLLLSAPKQTIDLGAYTGQLDLATYIAPLKKFYFPSLGCITFLYFLLVSIQNVVTSKTNQQEYRTAFLMGIPKKILFRAIFIHRALWIAISVFCSFIILFLFQNIVLNFLGLFTQLLQRSIHTTQHSSEIINFAAGNFWNFAVTSSQWLRTVFLATLIVGFFFVLITYIIEKIEAQITFYQVRKALKQHDH